MESWSGEETLKQSWGPRRKTDLSKQKTIDHEYYSAWFNFLGSVD